MPMLCKHPLDTDSATIGVLLKLSPVYKPSSALQRAEVEVNMVWQLLYWCIFFIRTGDNVSLRVMLKLKDMYFLERFFLFWSGGQEMFSINTKKCSGSCNLIFVFKPRPASFNKNKPWWWCRSPGCWPLICILSAGPCPWFSGRVQCES